MTDVKIDVVVEADRIIYQTKQYISHQGAKVDDQYVWNDEQLEP